VSRPESAPDEGARRHLTRGFSLLTSSTLDEFIALRVQVPHERPCTLVVMAARVGIIDQHHLAPDSDAANAAPSPRVLLPHAISTSRTQRLLSRSGDLHALLTR